MDAKTTFYVRYDPGLSDLTLHFYRATKGSLHLTDEEHLFCIDVTYRDAQRILFSIRETRYFDGEDGVIKLLRDLYRMYVLE